MEKCKHDLNKQVKREVSFDSTRIEAELRIILVKVFASCFSQSGQAYSLYCILVFDCNERKKNKNKINKTEATNGHRHSRRKEKKKINKKEKPKSTFILI